MTLGHIYIIEIRAVHPSYIQAAQRFLNAFSGGKNWATEVEPDGTLSIAIRNGSLDAQFHARFLQKAKAVEFRLTDVKTKLLFPDHPYGEEPKEKATQ